MSVATPWDDKPLVHVHTLPPVPHQVVLVDQWGLPLPAPRGPFPVTNAVARCGGCGRPFVTRDVDTGWTYEVRWVPLRWWHREGRQQLRLLDQRRHLPD